ncbi:MAG: luciferase family oxidoreductase group 1 [Candidatus Pseudothioglobus sp.]|jgi:luciferase family oxidoreductase group 1
MTAFSILDLSPIPQGSTAGQALNNSRDLAQHAERLGAQRYWVAEHHNMRGIASAATAVVIGHIAGGTKTIRVGAGGIMLPNHAPLVVAEQFGTLASLYPGRIDLGLGRAPGTDQVTAHALRRSLTSDVDDFPRDVVELRHYLGDAQPGQRVTAVPGIGTKVPLWILGSSLFGAQLAAMLGLPFAFASHFAPAYMQQAIEIYRSQFQPSEQLQKPHVMLGFNVCGAATDDEAQYLRSSAVQSFLNLRSGNPGPLPPPIKNFDATLSAQDHAMLDQVANCSAIGSMSTIRDSLAQFIHTTGADELMLVCSIFDHQKRVESVEITFDAIGQLQTQSAA